MSKDNIVFPRLFNLSLQSQYIILASVLGIIITLSIYFSYSVMTRHYHSLVENTRNTSEIRNNILKVRNHINVLANGIDLVTLQPEYKDQVLLVFQASFTEINQILDAVIEKELLGGAEFISALSQLSANLDQLRESAQRLFEVRTNVNQQYPGMEVSSRVLRPAQKDMMTALNLALQENDEDALQSKSPAYRAHLVHLKQLWTSTISAYRLYLANRMGSFDEEELYDQEVHVDEYLLEMKNQVAALLQYEALFGFESEELLLKLPEVLTVWRDGFAQVKQIHHSEAWRKDSEIMREEILPSMEAISANLLVIGRHLQQSNSQLVADFSGAGNLQTRQLIIIAIVFIAYSFIIYFFLKALVFKPLGILMGTLSADPDIDPDKLRGISKAKEIKNLVDSFLVMHGDVIRRQEELTYHALHDSLTSLPNRKLLMERLFHDIEIADRNSSSLSFLMLDLNGFKYVNDTLGHHVGDQLLIKVGKRLKETLRKVDTIARLGGDEFSIILPETGREHARVVAEKINKMLEQPFKVGEHALHVGTSIGITLYPDDGDNAHVLLKRADVAMYKSKQERKDFHFYEQQDDEHSIQQLSLTNDLKAAIENNSIELHYQPQLDVLTGELSGMEALLRWKHPELGYLPPEQIIEIAENAALIDDLALCVFVNALRDRSQLDDKYAEVSLAINLSVHNLRNDSFFDKLKAEIEKYVPDTQNIIFEVTESSMMADPEKSIEMLNELTSLGVKISVDDFGTGFSSLAYLKRLPVSELKIDRSFVRDMVEDVNDAVIVQSTIDLGHNLGLDVVAEGVEDQASLEKLKAMNCDICQGYYFSRPLGFDDLCQWLDRQKT
ncbi:MAG: EAL domain-containing protein [Gammaproteobacteria bacterium]|nr:EAL domain-containing protein [Gammaproteobacteria bacterium]